MTVSMAQIIHQMCQKCLGTIKGGVFWNAGGGVYPGDFYFFYTQVQDFLALFERNTV